MALQLNEALVLIQAATNCSILAISSLTLEKLPLSDDNLVEGSRRSG